MAAEPRKTGPPGGATSPLEGDSPLFWETLAAIERGMAERIRYDAEANVLVCICGERLPGIGDLLLHCWQSH
jgi:hypothetical protein